MRETKTYSKEFKEKLVKEYEELGNLSEVSKRHGVSINTIRHWILKKDNKNPSQSPKRKIQKLEKELQDKEMENQILKELLKKTNQVWLKE